MMVWDYPTAFKSWDGREQDAMNRVINSGRFTMGSEVEAFEEEFAAYHDKKHGIMVNSGSSANLVAVSAICHAKRLEHRFAFVPAIAWSTTYAPLVQHNFDLCIADVDETWNAPVVKWQPAGCVVACSILGNPGYLAEWREKADSIGAYLIEDNCESLGAAPKDGDICGSFGDLSTFSFFWSHQISAIEGGMILTDDNELADLCRMLRAHGWTRDLEHMQIVPGRCAFEDEYDFRVFGYNVRPLEMHAAIARVQLKKQTGFTAWRNHNYHYFWSLADKYLLPISRQKANGFMNPFGIAFLCRSKDERGYLVRRLRENGIDCRLPTGGSFLKHEHGKPWRDQKTPVADDIHERGLFLGNAPYDIERLIEKAVKVMIEALAESPAA